MEAADVFVFDGGIFAERQNAQRSVVEGEERQVLWRSLRERAENDQLYKVDLPEADIPPEVLMALLGIKDISKVSEVPDGYEVSDVSDDDEIFDGGSW